MNFILERLCSPDFRCLHNFSGASQAFLFLETFYLCASCEFSQVLVGHCYVLMMNKCKQNKQNKTNCSFRTEFREHRQITHQTRSFMLGQGGTSSHTCMGSTGVPRGKFLARTSTTAWARGHAQKTCSLCWSACTLQLAASAACHPQTQAEPLAQAIPWPPAPGTPCKSKRHQISFHLFPQRRLHTSLIL